MRLLADENIPRRMVEALRSHGHDVAWVCSDAPGSADSSVLAAARCDGRVLLTFDKDFGELAFRKGLPAGCGIVLFRMVAGSPTKIAQHAVAVLESRTDWSGHFSVIMEDHVRMTPLPGA